MKSLEELKALRDKARKKLELREDKGGGPRVVVGMATCGIAAGARPVMKAFEDEIAKRELSHVTVTQAGCIGFCKLEPIVEIYAAGSEKVTYVKMTPEKVVRVVAEHLVNDSPVVEYTVSAETR